MPTAVIPFLLALLWMFGRKSPGRDLSRRAEPEPAPPPRAPSAPRAPRAPQARPPRPAVPVAPPWPQVVPTGLPPWPKGWEPDEPVGAGVAARAAALLPSLWKYGEGTRKTEQTDGRWITYVATPHGTKRGVTAWRLVPGAPTTPVGPFEGTPGYGTRAAPEPSPVGPFEPGSTPGYGTRAAPEGVALRTLRLTSPRMTGEDVRIVQRKIGAGDDGVYGTGTAAAVRTWQASHRGKDGNALQVDGVVGPKTWAALMG